MAVPNQKTLEVSKQEKSTKDELVSVRSQSAERLAAKILTPSAFKMWLAITQNKNGYVFDLSSTFMSNEWGISIASYKRAVAELQEKGYMIEKEGKKNSFLFYDKPQEQSIEIEIASAAIDYGF